MAVYLREFATQAAYEAAQSSLILPNVSLIDETNEVAYNPYLPPETRVVAKYNVTDTSSPTQIIGEDAESPFSAIEIDGVEQPSVVSAYTFSTTGEHTVKYTLADQTSIGTTAFHECSSLTSITIPNSVTSIGDNVFADCTSLTSCTIGSGVTSIGDRAFYNCSSLTSIVIPDSVTSINAMAFKNCSGLTSIDIPSGVTSIGTMAFKDCSSLTSIVSNATTAPTITNNTFWNVKTGGTLTVPSGSSGYDIWMDTSNFYLGKYNWTKVEQ